MIVKKFDSATQAGVVYTTSYDPVTNLSECKDSEGNWCKGWLYSNHNCKHVKACKADESSTTFTKVAPPAGFIRPMLASPIDETMSFSSGWVAEEKFDGHRLIVRVAGGAVTAWSRNGKVRDLPFKMRADLVLLPDGVYDGELTAPGHRHHGVADHGNRDIYEFVVFDLLETLGKPLVKNGYGDRRKLLEMIGETMRGSVLLADVHEVHSWEEVADLARKVWARKGEGLIVKHTLAPYEVGRRSKYWLKVKHFETSVTRITSFAEGSLGSCAVTNVVGEDGEPTSVKTKDAATRKRLEAKPKSFIGRLLRIEHQGRTPDGSYVSPMWDRFEDE